MPVVRVDHEVWKWLQSLARPFEDTPNAVLRRVAKLDPPAGVRQSEELRTKPQTEKEDSVLERSGAANRNTASKRVTGEQLNRKYRLGARHALYHKDGTFYEHLVQFPGILCDTRGFVRYDSKQQFESDPRISIGEKVNIHQSLGSHPRYQRFPGLR